MKSERKKITESITYSLATISILWIVKLFEFQSGLDFSFLGIFPRTVQGSVGILTSPLVHGDFNHLLSNSFPLLMLMCGVTYFYNVIASRVIFLIYIITGVVVWIFARQAYHIGASGLVYGLVSFLFVSGVLRRDPASVAISLAVIFLYGGMIYGLFPTDPNISYESHIIGVVAGGMIATFYRSIKVMPVTRYSFENEQKASDSNTSSNTTLSEFNYEFKPKKNKEDKNKINYRIDL